MDTSITRYKYCLTYDAKNSDKLSADDLKLAIVRTLINEHAFNVESPVASTILFEDDNKNYRLKHWDAIINNAHGKQIYYYLCLVAQTKGNQNIEADRGDESIKTRFKKLLNTLLITMNLKPSDINR